jgi:putative hydrolase of the HAD superfamily
MMNDTGVNTLFLDIGGVLLTNGYDFHIRQRAAEKFGIDYEEMNERHHMTFGTYEMGKITLDEYLRRTIFFKDRPFMPEEYKDFVFSQVQSFPEMIQLVRKLRNRYRLRIAAVSNEGRELTVRRIRQFVLNEFIDFFVVSCYVQCRKPDEEIYRIALDMSAAAAPRVVYIEDRDMFVDVAKNLGIQGILHTGYESTRRALSSLGLSLPEEQPEGR